MREVIRGMVSSSLLEEEMLFMITKDDCQAGGWGLTVPRGLSSHVRFLSCIYINIYDQGRRQSGIVLLDEEWRDVYSRCTEKKRETAQN